MSASGAMRGRNPKGRSRSVTCRGRAASYPETLSVAQLGRLESAVTRTLHASPDRRSCTCTAWLCAPAATPKGFHSVIVRYFASLLSFPLRNSTSPPLSLYIRDVAGERVELEPFDQTRLLSALRGAVWNCLLI